MVNECLYVGNQAPYKELGILKKRKNDKAFFTPDDVVDVIIKNLPTLPTWCEILKPRLSIGGQITRRSGVIAHKDFDDDTEYSCVWFTEAHKKPVFFVGNNMYHVKTGDVFIFNHTSVHGVCFDIEGKFTFMSFFVELNLEDY